MYVLGCCLDVPEYPFDDQYDSFAFNSLLTREESIQGIGKVRTECNKVAAMSLFHIPTTKHMKIEEFEQTQSQATSQVTMSSAFILLKSFVYLELKHLDIDVFDAHFRCPCF